MEALVCTLFFSNRPVFTSIPSVPVSLSLQSDVKSYQDFDFVSISALTLKTVCTQTHAHTLDGTHALAKAWQTFCSKTSKELSSTLLIYLTCWNVYISVERIVLFHAPQV